MNNRSHISYIIYHIIKYSAPIRPYRMYISAESALHFTQIT